MSNFSHCGQCGQKNPSNDNYCSKCGSPITILPQKSEKVFGQQLQATNACPKCKKTDQIQKLSSIVSTGTRQTSGQSVTSGATNLSGGQKYYSRDNKYVGSGDLSGTAYSSSSTQIDFVEQSVLAKKLLPPEKPSTPTKQGDGIPGWYTTVGTGIAIVVGIGGACSVPWAMGYPNSFFASMGTLFLIPIVGAIGGGIIVSLTFLLGKKLFATNIAAEDDLHEYAMQRYKQKMTAWEDAMTRWKNMYYCHRDDIVFIPEQEMFATPQQVVQLCYHRS